MDHIEVKKEKRFLNIDFSDLMDLRVDYAFKLIFGTGDTRHLISLLNAVFANKNIPRIIKSLIVVNPYLEKQAKEDKLSILDIRAQLDDGTSIQIEMHLYDLDELKYKTIRSWARVYGEELKAGERYLSQLPVICVAFVNGSLDSSSNRKIHKCCKIMDIDDYSIFTDALELHYINMKEFVKTINKTGGIGKGETKEILLAKWLSIICEKDIKDKTIIKNICEEEEEIGMVVSELVRMNEDTIIRQAYQRRQDDIMVHNRLIRDYKDIAEQERRRAEQAEKEKIELAKQAEIELAKQAEIIAELRAQINEKQNPNV